MSDLRDRIAAAIQARDEAAIEGIDDPFMVEHASYDDLADAVIAELGLERESLKPDSAVVKGMRVMGLDPVRLHRYVTDWKADDEQT